MIKQDKEFLKLVGALVTQARTSKGLPQEQVAMMLSISRPQVTNIETGTCGTTPEMMLKLSVIFNCPIGDLFPTPDIYKPKLKIPPPKEVKSGRKVRGPNTYKPAYLIMKENEELKKQLEQFNKAKEVTNG